MNQVDRPVFIIGSHRSGTTLVRYLLDSHPRLACPPESKFLMGIESLLIFPQTLLGLETLGFNRAMILAKLRTLIEDLFNDYAKRQSKSRWIDKTPNYYRILDLIDEIFEKDALYLFVLRHPFDCVSSMEEAFGKRVYRDDPDLRDNATLWGTGRYGWAKYWQTVYERIDVFSGAILHRSHFIKYEDLVADPRKVTESALVFLGEKPTDDLVSRAFSQPHTRGYQDPKITKTRSVHQQSVGRWRDWPDAEAQALWNLVHRTAERFGYSLKD